MRKGSSKNNPELVAQLEQIKALVEESIRLARADRPAGVAPTRRAKQPDTVKTSVSMDFSTPIRPFIKKHAAGMSGPKKFTLLLAYLAGGNVGKKVSSEDIQKHWSKMTAKGLLGVKFNRFYSAAARENDWVHTEKSGLYQLRPSWKTIFNDKR